MFDYSLTEREFAAKHLYNTDDLTGIEKVLQVFSAYIKAAKHFDIIWSNKVGYIFLNDLQEPEEFDSVPFLIQSGEEICDRLFYEVGVDVMLEHGRTVDISEANPQERKAVLDRLEPYANQLPEYQHLMEKVFRQSDFE